MHDYHILNPNWKLGKKLYFSSLLECYFCCISIFWQLSIFFSLPCPLNWTPHQVHKLSSWLFLCRSKKKMIRRSVKLYKVEQLCVCTVTEEGKPRYSWANGLVFFFISIMAKALNVNFFFMIIYEFHNFI